MKREAAEVVCEVRGEDLVAYRDGDLRGARQEWVATHARLCPVCRERLAGFEETARILREAFPLVDDPVGRAKLIARLQIEASRQSSRRDRHRLLVAAPLLLLLLLLALVAGPGSSEAGFPLARFIHFGVVEVKELWPADQQRVVEHVATSQPGLTAVTFRAVEPAELPLGLTLVERSIPARERLELLYRNGAHLAFLLRQSPAREAMVSTDPGNDDQVITVSDTQVLWIKDARPEAVAGLWWERHQVFFEVMVTESPEGPTAGLKLGDARLVVQALMAEQDARQDG